MRTDEREEAGPDAAETAMDAPELVRKNRTFRLEDPKTGRKHGQGKRRSASPRTESGEGWTSILSGSRPRRVDPVVAKVQQEQQSVLSALKGLTASDFAPVPEGPQTLERRSAGEHSRMSREKLEERIAENENKIRDAKEQIRELDEEEAALTRKLRQIIEREKETRLDRFARMILKSGLSMTEVRERLGLPRKEG
jgi:hypothetical protein